MTSPLTARGWVFLGLVGLLILLGFGLARGVYKPKVEKAMTQVESSTDAAVAADLGRQGAEATTAQVAAHHNLKAQVSEKTHALDQQAARDPQTQQLVPDGVRARLLDHDRFLCGIRPAVCTDRPAATDRDPG